MPQREKQPKHLKRPVSAYIRQSVYDRISAEADTRDTTVSELVRQNLNETYGDQATAGREREQVDT